MDESNAIIKLTSVSKKYIIYPNSKERFKSLFFRTNNYYEHNSLINISLEINKGDCVGLIGDNGAGKSTLLKLLVGTLHPSKGHITRPRRITAILELGSGFHAEFTGRENLYFSGSLMGFSSNELKTLESSIIEFSELGEAIDRPIKTYSSGMVVRLAFSLVTAIEPDLLVIDEALAVGDQNFQKKCINKILEFKNKGCTILFCSHSLYHIKHLCNKAIWLEQGKLRLFAKADDVVDAYTEINRINDNKKIENIIPTASSKSSNIQDLPIEKDCKIIRSSINKVFISELDDQDIPILISKDLTLVIEVDVHTTECPSIAIMIEQYEGIGISSIATHADGVSPKKISENKWKITGVFNDISLHTGNYVLSIYLFSEDGLVVYDQWYQYKIIRIVNNYLTPGLIQLPHKWI